MQPQQQIDYSPLDKMHHSGWHVFRTAFKGYSLLLFFVAFALSILIAITTSSGVASLPLFIYIAALIIEINAYKNGIWKEFATVNNWQIDTATSETVLTAPSVNYGHSRHIGIPIKAQLGSLGCDIYIYDTTTGAGKYQVTHYFTLAMVQLPKAMPHIILNSKKDKADIETKFQGDEKLKLEGNFGDYFNLLVAKGQEIDALAVLTPDLMQTLIDDNSDEDIEINGQQLYFILRDDKRDTESIKRLIESVEKLCGQIIQNISLASTPQALPSAAQRTEAPPVSPTTA